VNEYDGRLIGIQGPAAATEADVAGIARYHVVLPCL
jgi:hypothetical protein